MGLYICMRKRGLIGLIVIVMVALVIGFFWFVESLDREEECVAASCCHATECVLESEAPNCSDTVCSLNCEPGTLDCGQARCEYVDGECGVVKNE